MLGILALVCGFIYSQVAGFEFVIFDDPGYARDNPHVRSGLCGESVRWAFASCEFSNWHPLTWLSLMLDGQLYGGWSGGFHLTNALLHFLNCALLFLWLRAAVGGENDFRPAAAAALLFAAHPMHVESVAWVTERKDVLSAFFFLLTLCAYTRYAQDSGKWHRAAYAASLVFFALGLMVKPMLVTVPPLLLLLDCWPLRRLIRTTTNLDSTQLATVAPTWRSLFVEKIPFCVLAALSATVTCLVQRRAEVSLTEYPLHRRLLHVVSSYGEYLSKTIWPDELAIPYRFSSQVQPATLCMGAVVLLAGTLGAWRLRQSRGYLLIGWLWFLGTLVPVIGLVQVGEQRIADRYVYLPHMGLFFACGYTLFHLPVRSRFLRAVIPVALCVGVVAAFAVLSRAQARLWRNSVALFEHSLEVNGPDHYQGNRLLAQAHLDAKNAVAARAHADAALRLWPGNPNALDLAAAARLAQSDWEAAIPILSKLSERQPERAATLTQLGHALAKVGRFDAAQIALERAVKLQPLDAETRFTLARVMEHRGDSAGVAACLEGILKLEPAHRRALRTLAWLRATSADATVRDGSRALALAECLAGLEGTDSLVVLDCRAAAFAALGRWADADLAAEGALARAVQVGSPTEIARRTEMVRIFRARQSF